MDDGHLSNGPARFHLVADLGHNFFGHLGVGLIFEMDDVAPARKTASHTPKDDDRPVGFGTDGIFERDLLDRPIDDLEHALAQRPPLTGGMNAASSPSCSSKSGPT